MWTFKFLHLYNIQSKKYFYVFIIPKFIYLKFVKVSVLSYFMALEDFENHSQLKFMVPIVYVISWLAMIFGPFYFPIHYNHYCMLILMYLALRSFILCGLNMKLVQNYHEMMKSTTNFEEKQRFIQQRSFMEIYHAFIIPSYNQDLELLAETLSALASHQRAKQSYLIFLAMEKHQVSSQTKALKLIRMFYGKFMYIAYTLHQLQCNEHKGKASNVNFCALTLQKTFNKLMIDQKNVFLTIIDSDSIAPQLYIEEVEKNILKNLQNCHKNIYQPPQIYARNNFEVNAVIRTYDDMYSSMHASSLISLSGISFSLSNYTLSYSLTKNVGFWDTNQEAIGQDMHMCLKAIFKTEGQIKTIPIYTPFNQLNIQTGNGAIKDLKAKFWQVERHARGVADVSYCISTLIKSKLNLKSLWATVSLIETFFLPIVTPWVIISAFCQNFIIHQFLSTENLTFTPQILCSMITLANLGTFISNLIYEIFKRRSAKQLHKVQNPGLWRVFEGSLLYSINIIFFTIPAFVCGTFGNLMTNREYKVTQKNSMKLRKQDSISLI